MRRSFASVICALVVMLVPSETTAQTITTGAVIGAVTNDDGSTLADVQVSVTADEGGASRSVASGYDGRFRIALLAPGTYSVLVERLGYRPKLVEGVPVLAGREVLVAVSLKPAPPPIEAPDRVMFDGVAGVSRPGVSQTVSVLSLSQLPWERRETSELAGLATRSNEALETEGLPSSLSTVTVDGLLYETARHPSLARDQQREIALPVSLLQSAELVTADADGEWTGFAGGALAVQTRRGASSVKLDSFGSWSGGGLHTSKFFDDGNVSNTSLWGGAVLSGPIVRDTAHFVIALEGRKLDTPLSSAWQRDPTVDAALIDVAQNTFDVGLDQYARPFLLQSNVISGFGRFDWQITNDNAFSVRAGFGNISPASGDADVAAATLPETVANGTDLFLTGSLTTRVRRDWVHEVRAGFLKSTRDYENDDALTVLPSTRVVAGALQFGNDPHLPGKLQRTDLMLDQTLQIPSSAHQLKFGISARASFHDDTYNFASGGAFVFGGPTEFEQSRGAFVQSSLSSAADFNFSLVRLGAFVQDVWYATPTLRLTAGIRYDVFTLPQSDITPNAEWLLVTGLANDSIDEKANALSPRFNLTWDVDGRGSWVVSATAARYSDDIDAGAINELLLGDGDLRVRRAFGNLGSWPTPTAANLPASRPALTLLGPGFRAPQTDRASFGLSRRVGSASVQFSGTYRNTEFLARRSDLNMFTTPSAHDQNGRPIFGSLVKIGDLVGVAQPNRRFTEFDMVSALAADGWSHYWGITAALERPATGKLGFFASYTYSETTDNWPSNSQLTPFPDNSTADWLEGTSDFDVPHRLSAGLELRPGGALQPSVTAVYKYRSGYPFTPGFVEGVDVNGDGALSNDPAFVDDAIVGTSELFGEWDCLRSQLGRFAERNACRQSGVHSLNVHVGFTLLRSSGTSAQVFVDGLNLIESTQAEPDRALYLIDPAGTLAVDQNQARVTIPLVVNPHFGMPLVRFGRGRMLRIGLQVNH